VDKGVSPQRSIMLLYLTAGKKMKFYGTQGYFGASLISGSRILKALIRAGCCRGQILWKQKDWKNC
jgi:hypothetical protein